MRVVLKQEVRGLGRPGDVKEVADGYAQNFLLPKGLAIEASAGELKRVAQERASAQAKQDRAHDDAVALATKLDHWSAEHAHDPYASLGSVRDRCPFAYSSLHGGVRPCVQHGSSVT